MRVVQFATALGTVGTCVFLVLAVGWGRAAMGFPQLPHEKSSMLSDVWELSITEAPLPDDHDSAACSSKHLRSQPPKVTFNGTVNFTAGGVLIHAATGTSQSEGGPHAVAPLALTLARGRRRDAEVRGATQSGDEQEDQGDVVTVTFWRRQQRALRGANRDDVEPSDKGGDEEEGDESSPNGRKGEPVWLVVSNWAFDALPTAAFRRKLPKRP